MNWVGGVRNRLKVQNDKRQKEFFERRKFQSRVENASKSPGKRGGVNLDLLSIRTISKTHTEENGKTGIPFKPNERRISVVNLDSSHRSNRLCNIELPNMSPIKKPSVLHLMDSENSQRIVDTRKKTAANVLDKWALPQHHRLARKTILSQATPAFSTKPSDSYYNRSVSCLGSASRADTSGLSSSSFDESIGILTDATPQQSRALPSKTYARKYELSDIEPETPFLPYSKPGPRSVMSSKSGTEEWTLKRPLCIDGPRTSTPLCGVSAFPTVKATSSYETGGRVIYPTQHGTDNCNQRKRHPDNLTSIEEFQVTPLKKYIREAERKREHPRSKNLDFPMNPLSAAVDDELFNRGCRRTLNRPEIYTVPLKEDIQPMLASAAPTLAECMPEGAGQPPTKQILRKPTAAEGKYQPNGRRSITLPGPAVISDKHESTSDRWEKACSTTFISPLQLPDVKGNGGIKLPHYDSDESVISPISRKNILADGTRGSTKPETENVSEVKKTPNIPMKEKKSWLSFLSGGVKRKEKVSWEQNFADKAGNSGVNESETDPFKRLSEKLKKEMIQTLGEQDKSLLTCGDKVEGFCLDNSRSPRPAKPVSLNVRTSQPPAPDQVWIKESASDVSAHSLVGQPTFIDPCREGSHPSLQDHIGGWPGDKTPRVSHVTKPSPKPTQEKAQIYLETPTEASEMNPQAMFLNLYNRKSPVFPPIIKTSEHELDSVEGFVQGLLHGLVAEVIKKAIDTDRGPVDPVTDHPRTRSVVPGIGNKAMARDEISEDPLTNELSDGNEGLQNTHVIGLKDLRPKTDNLARSQTVPIFNESKDIMPSIHPDHGEGQSSVGIQVDESSLKHNCVDSVAIQVGHEKCSGDADVDNRHVKSVGVQTTYSDIMGNKYINIHVQTADDNFAHAGVQVRGLDLINYDSKALQVNEWELGAFSSKGLQVESKAFTETVNTGVQVAQSDLGAHQSRQIQVDQTELISKHDSMAVQVNRHQEEVPCGCLHAASCTYNRRPILSEPTGLAVTNDAARHCHINFVSLKASQPSETSAKGIAPSPAPVRENGPSDEVLPLKSSAKAPSMSDVVPSMSDIASSLSDVVPSMSDVRSMSENLPLMSQSDVASLMSTHCDVATSPLLPKPHTNDQKDVIESDGSALTMIPNLPPKTDTSQSQPIDLSTKHDNLLKLLREERKRIRTQLTSDPSEHATNSYEYRPNDSSSQSEPMYVNVACATDINEGKYATLGLSSSYEQLQKDASQAELCHSCTTSDPIPASDHQIQTPSKSESEDPPDIETCLNKNAASGEHVTRKPGKNCDSPNNSSWVLCYTENRKWEELRSVEDENKSGIPGGIQTVKKANGTIHTEDMAGLESASHCEDNVKVPFVAMKNTESAPESEENKDRTIIVDSQSSQSVKGDCSETDCYFSLESDTEVAGTDNNDPSDSDNRGEVLNEQLSEQPGAVIVEEMPVSVDLDNDHCVNNSVGVPLNKYRLRSWRQREV